MDISLLEPPYDRLVTAKREGGNDADLIQAAGLSTYNTAIAAASTVAEDDDVVKYLELLQRTAALAFAGNRLQRYSSRMLRGEEVDKAELDNVIAKLDNNEREFATLDKVEPEENLWIPSYWPAIDEYVGGLPVYGLVLMAGSPGGGKTSGVVKLIDRMTRHRNKVGLFTLEVTNAIIKQRWLNMRPNLPPRQAALAYSCDLNYNLDEVCASIVRLVSQEPDIYCIFIDFADLLVAQESTENASEIYVKLAMTAKKIRKPIVLICQLSRSYRERGGGQPTVTDIRWSGLAEAMATLILLVYNPNQLYVDTGGDKKVRALPVYEGKGYLIEGKSRYGYLMGGIGAVRIDWKGAQGWGDEGDAWEPLGGN